MADHNSSMESVSSAEETSSVVHPADNACEASMWDGWTQESDVDEVSTSNFLPEIGSTSSRLSFHQSDMLSASWLPSFHLLSHNTLQSQDLAHNPDSADQPPAFMQHEGLVIDPDHSLADMYLRSNSKHFSGSSYSVPNKQCDAGFLEWYGEYSAHFVCSKPTATLQQTSRNTPHSPSSPRALHSGMPHPFADHPNLPWPSPRSHASTARRPSFVADHFPSALTHLEGFATRYGPAVSRAEVFMGPHGNFVSAPVGCAPQDSHGGIAGPLTPMASSFTDIRGNTSISIGSNLSSMTRLHQDMNLLRREERTSTSGSASCGMILNNWTRSGSSIDSQARLGKRRLGFVEVGGRDAKSPPPKRPNPAIDHPSAFWASQSSRRLEPNSYQTLATTTTSNLASPAMNVFVVGPALNTNGKPRARRGSATDPQSVYARQRRDKINERLKTLQHLVPNGSRVDIVTMLEEAIHYVKFLQLQLLRSDEFWMHATPNTYKGIDMSTPPVQLQEPESSA